MPVGITLSQLIAESPEPLASGVEPLDEALGGGFQPRSLYELVGPPGTGRTRLALQLVERTKASTLWIEAFKPLPTGLLTPEAKQRCFRTRCTKFTQLLYLWQTLTENYALVVIDGLSQLLCDHMNYLHARAGPANLHDTKCRHLSTLFTAMTKYAHSNGSTVLLVDHCMNTSFANGNPTAFEQDLDVVDDGSNFLVTSTTIKRNVQVLRSALTASGIAMGPRDSRWECFLAYRITLCWEWDYSNGRTPARKRMAIITQPSNTTAAARASDAVQVPCVLQSGAHQTMQEDVVWDSEG